MSIPTVQQWINGQWVASPTGETMDVLNPTTDAIVAKVQKGDARDAEMALQAAEKAQKTWKKIPARKRAELLRAFCKEIRDNKEKLANMITEEQGKLHKVALFEVEVCCSFIEYSCEWARHIEGDIVPSDNEHEQILIQKVPKGVVVAITAWNFPVALAGRKLGPALIAGNTVVLKPTEETPVSTLWLGELAKNAGIPDGVINIVNGLGSTTGAALCTSPITKMITMTGSTRAGQMIYKSAYENLTHVQLELGGKAPFIVFADADLDVAVDGAMCRWDNCGQVCTCNERMYIHENVYDAFMEKFMAKVKALKVGDPFDAATDIGPKVNKNEVKHMHEIVKKAVEEGAKVLCGGKEPEGEMFKKGCWFEPTVLADVTQNMTCVHEEIFGPILPVLKFKDEAQVIGWANDCEFGLAAMVCTNDMNRIMRLKDDLEFGEVYINRGHGELHQGFHNGLKKSGTGGEDGKYGLEQYLEKKVFYIKYTPQNTLDTPQ